MIPIIPQYFFKNSIPLLPLMKSKLQCLSSLINANYLLLTIKLISNFTVVRHMIHTLAYFSYFHSNFVNVSLLLTHPCDNQVLFII